MISVEVKVDFLGEVAARASFKETGIMRRSLGTGGSISDNLILKMYILILLDSDLLAKTLDLIVLN